MKDYLKDISAAALDVVSERKRQMDIESWSYDHDDLHVEGELATAAACYIRPDLRQVKPIQGGNDISDPWPWYEYADVSGGRGDCPVHGQQKAWWKPTDRRRDLVKAGALIIAEIERLDRAAALDDETETCFICEKPLEPGQMVLFDVNEGPGHRACFGEDRDAYVKDIDTGEPLGPDDPIPSGFPYEADRRK